MGKSKKNRQNAANCRNNTAHGRGRQKRQSLCRNIKPTHALVAVGSLSLAALGALYLSYTQKPVSTHTPEPRKVRQSFYPSFNFSSLKMDLRYPDNMSTPLLAKIKRKSYEALANSKVPARKPLPDRLELIITDVKNDLELLTQKPRNYERFVTSAQNLVRYARPLLRTAGIHAPDINIQLAQSNEQLRQETPHRELMAGDLPVYVTGRSVQTAKAKLAVYKNDREIARLFLEGTMEESGHASKTVTINFQQNPITASVKYTPITYNLRKPLEGEELGYAADNVLAEYLHIIFTQYTLKQALDDCTSELNKGAIKKNRKGWQQIAQTYGFYEEQLVHGIAHTISKQWLDAEGLQYGTFSGNYPGVQNVERLCDRVGVIPVLKNYKTSIPSVLKKAGLSKE